MLCRIASLLLFVVPIAPTVRAQWVPTGVSTSNIDGINDLEWHDGVLFASSNSRGFIRSTDLGGSWMEVGQTGFVTTPNTRFVTAIESAGPDLFVITFEAFTASSMVYRSSDGGNSFVPDTTGLPRAPSTNETVNIDHFYHHNGWLYADVANLGNWRKEVNGSAWVKNNHAGVAAAEEFAFHGDSAYAWGGYYLLKSDDNGATWTTPGNEGLPPWFSVGGLAVNAVTGRIYAVGTSATTRETRFIYSDDEGERWETMAIDPYLKNSWLGLRQTIRAIFAHGEYIQISLDNDAWNSPPDVLMSTDGGATFTRDEEGLHADASATTTGVAFEATEGFLFMALNFRDIYRKAVSFGTSVEGPPGLDTGVALYPNPTTGRVTVQTKQPLLQVSVYDATGRRILHRTGLESGARSLELSRRGVYIVRFVDQEGRVSTRKIVVN